MKKVTTILLLFALALSLVGCGGKIRQLENYSVGQYKGGWSVLYTDEKGVEEIAALGSERQPLAIEKGRIYFTQGSLLVSVDMDGEERLETELTGMPAGTHITMVDEENFYCVADPADLRCWRVSKTDQNDWAYITVPRTFRAVDYEDIAAQVTARIAAKEDKIRVSAARAELDSNGSVVLLELETLAYRSIIGGMKTWDTGRVTVRLTLDGAQVSYTNLNVPMSVSDKTIGRTLALADYLDAVARIDASQAAVQYADGAAEGFVLAYLVGEYEACAVGNKQQVRCLNLDGAQVSVNESVRHLVLAQVGGCDTLLTDSRGSAVGNLLRMQLD